MVSIHVDAQRPGPVINRNIYGHFSEHLGRCVYGGLFVGKDSPIPNENGMRTDVVEALKHIRVPVLRWPGGCFADEYHWRDGVGPQEKRKRMVNKCPVEDCTVEGLHGGAWHSLGALTNANVLKGNNQEVPNACRFAQQTLEGLRVTVTRGGHPTCLVLRAIQGR